jgi:glucose/arabinose dehydrogenase
MPRWAGPRIVTLADRMLRRIAFIALVLGLLAPAAAAAQTQPTQPPTQSQQQPTQPQQQPTQPFSPLPPSQPTPAPTPEPEDEGFLDSEISGTSTLYVIAGGLLIAFIAIGMFISRDARKALPAGHRPDSHRLRDEGPHKHKREAKARARAKGKAQKAARRRNR